MRFKSASFSKLALSVLLVLSSNFAFSCVAAKSSEKESTEIATVRELCRNRDYLKAFKLCQDYIIKIENSENMSEAIDVYNMFSLIANETYSLKFASELYKTASEGLVDENLKSIDKCERLLKLGEANRNHAVALRLISKYDDSISLFRKSLTNYDEAFALKANPSLVKIGKAETLRALGSFYTLLFDYDVAKSNFEKVLKIVDELLLSDSTSSEYLNLKIRTLIDYGDLERERGEYEFARSRFEAANKLLGASESIENFGSAYYKVQTLTRLSSVSLRTKDFTGASKYANDAVALADQAFTKWSDNPEARILYANTNFNGFSLFRKKIPIEIRNKCISALESCIANYPDSYSIYRYICESYEAVASSGRYKKQDENDKLISISFDDFGGLGGLPLNALPVKLERENYSITSAHNAERNFEFDLAETALESARRLNPDNVILMSDEAYLLERRFIPFEMTSENVNLMLEKIDSCLAKEKRLLRPHLMKVILLNQPIFIFKGMDKKKIQDEKEKELEFLNILIPKRIKEDYMD